MATLATTQIIDPNDPSVQRAWQIQQDQQRDVTDPSIPSDPTALSKQDKIKLEIRKLQARNPSMTFQSAWNQLQTTHPYLFTEDHGAPISGGYQYRELEPPLPTTLKGFSDKLIEYSKTNELQQSAYGKRLVQAVDAMLKTLRERSSCRGLER